MNNQKQELRYQELTTAPVRRLVLKMAVPTIIGMLVNSIYSITDTFFVSMLGDTEKTASVGIIFSFVSLIQAVGFLFGHGSGNYMSRQLGKKNVEEAQKMASLGFFTSVICGVVIMAAGLVFSHSLVTVLGGGVNENLRENCTGYLCAVLCCVPFMTGALTLNSQLRLQGNAKDGMIGMILGMVVNMLLDPILILGGKMGVLGAGIATAVGQVLSFLVLVYLCARHGNIGPSLRELSFSKERLTQIFGGGMPNFIRQGITSVAGISLNQAAGAYGGGAIAAFTVTYRVFWIVYAVVIGFGQGFQPVCGYNYGAGKIARVREAFFFCVRSATVFLLVMAVAVFFGAERIISCFSADRDVVAMGVKILKFQSFSMPFLAYYILAGMLFQNIGKFFAATIETAMRQGIFYIPLIFLLPACMGFDGVVLAQPVSDVLSFLCAVFMGIWMFRKNLSKTMV